MDKQQIENLTKEMKERIGSVREIMEKAHGGMEGMQPELMKLVTIEGMSGKMTLHKNGMINIVFDTPENGKKLYEKW